nr:MAG TPA: adenylosuccinate synthetase [Caudoviricetes sp.]
MKHLLINTKKMIDIVLGAFFGDEGKRTDCP